MKTNGRLAGIFYTEAGEKFYSVSISGYHIAEAGANPITQLAFTLATDYLCRILSESRNAYRRLRTQPVFLF